MRCIGLFEQHAVGSQSVDVRCVNCLAAVRADIANAQIVGKDKNDIWLREDGRKCSAEQKLKVRVAFVVLQSQCPRESIRLPRRNLLGPSPLEYSLRSWPGAVAFVPCA